MISIIVPCYNEQEALPFFHEEVSRVLNGDWRRLRVIICQ